MKRTAQDILNFVEDNDVKFAKLTFCDIFGNQKNVSLFASELPRAFAEGVSFDGSSIAGFMNVEESDLVLWPDPDTATVLPWRPTEGRVIINGQDLTKMKRRKVPYYRWEGVGLHGEQNIKAGEGPVESLCLCGKDLAGVNVAGRVLTRQGEGIFAHGAPSFRVLLMTV